MCHDKEHSFRDYFISALDRVAIGGERSNTVRAPGNGHAALGQNLPSDRDMAGHEYHRKDCFNSSAWAPTAEIQI